jgi:two-component system CheB/CheR fusion protein
MVPTPMIPASQGTDESSIAIVAIGASAGGLQALERLFDHVPAEPGAAFVIIVHLAPDHESHLVALLQPHTRMPVQQVTQTVPIEKDHVYVIPPNANLEATHTHLRLTELEQRGHTRAPIDHFFHTLAQAHQGQAIGIVLSGTGSDGTLGLRHIKANRGLTVAQNPDEAEYDEMPRSAISAAGVDLVLPVAEIPAAVLQFIHTDPRLVVPADGEDIGEDTRRFLHRVLAQIRTRTGRDFSRYKHPTILRRLARRMQLNVRNPDAYLELLREKPDELHALADELLITVTNFFRDSEVFEFLAHRVIPSLFENKSAHDCIRVWSAGCATGEEAYSLAILLLEEASRRDSPPSIQVFATDLHEQSLEKAREGLYPSDIKADVSPERLDRFFQPENGWYRVRKEVRELVLFASHNLLTDPPFSKLDLIACRNLLIYFDRDLHQQVVELFHYALQPDGFLAVGTSENIENRQLFRVENKKCHVYRKRNVPAPMLRLPVFPAAHLHVNMDPERPHKPAADYGALHKRIVEQHAPPSLLVNANDELLHVSASASRYLVLPEGTLTTNALKLVREELRIELHMAVSEARRQQQLVRSKPVIVHLDGQALEVELVVAPALEPVGDGLIVVSFVERPAPEGPSQTQEPLQAEKHRMDQRLAQVLELHEVNQQELRASNEELQSTNEELRSSLEELESSKEELQSINEELQILSQENRHKVEELDQLSSDLQNLLAATDIATLFLDRNLRILRFTPKIEDLFSVRPSDRGRLLSDFTNRLGYAELGDDARKVLERFVAVERIVQADNGRWYLTRLLPYRFGEDRIAGIVATFVDITPQKQAQEALHRGKDYAESIIETLPEPLLVLTPELRVELANAAFYRHFRVPADQTKGRKIYELGNGQWDIPALRELLEDVLPSNESFEHYVVNHVFEQLGRRVMLVNARKLEHMQLILLGISDITERHEAEQALRASEERFRALLAASSDAIYRMDPDWTQMRERHGREFLPDLDTPTSRWLDNVYPDDQPRVQTVIDEAIRSKSTFEFEHRVLRIDGSVGWTHSRAVPILDDAGEIVEWFGAASDITARLAAEEALAAQAHALSRLNDLSSQLWRTSSLSEGLEAMLGATIEMLGADMGNILLLDGDVLRTVAQRGLGLPIEHDSACDRALRSGQPCVIEDVELDAAYAPMLEVARAAGYRAVLSTPMSGRGGVPLGVLSIYFRAPHRPSEHALRCLDLVVRQARDFIARYTTERAFRESEARLRMATAAAGMFVWECDPIRGTIHWSENAAAVIGCDPEELPEDIEHGLFFIAPQDTAQVLQDYQDALAGSQTVYHSEFRGHGEPGTARHYLAHTRILYAAGSPVQVIGVVQDITQRKRAEQALEEAGYHKDEFLAMLGHELRNPLAAICRATEIMAHRSSEDAGLEWAIGVLERQSTHMTGLIDGLLDVSGIARGKIHLAPKVIDVREVIDGVLQDRGAKIEARSLELERELPPEPIWVLADHLRLTQVFDNLLGNAIKFTNAPGKISVTLREADGNAIVRVRDTGVGIRPDLLEQIFVPFQQQTQDLARVAGGLGLGLALAKTLVELHGGNIRVHSDGPGTGAEFVVCLPMTSGPATAADATPAAEIVPRQILLVEDNIDAGQVLHTLLTSLGHVVRLAETGNEALELLRARGADIVLCDLGLPDISGYEVARAVRDDASLRATTLIALTGYGQPEDRRRAKEAGFDDYIIKPPSREILDKVLGRLSGTGAPRAPA